MNSFHILVVCTGNICRSPMAEGMLRHGMPDDFRKIVTVASAGTDALHGNQATPLAVQAMAHYDIDISGHRARRLSRSLVVEADLILAMEHYHLRTIRTMQFFAAGKAHLLSRFDTDGVSYEVPDPMGGSLELYMRAAKLISNCLDGIYSYLEERIDV